MSSKKAVRCRCHFGPSTLRSRREFDGEQISIYAPRDFGTTMTWDLRFAWENTTGVLRETLFANLDVTNVLNRRHVAQHIDDWAGAYEEFELCRHFQLEVGYCF